jgi:uncharacterized protein
MNEQRNIDTIRRGYEAFGLGDIRSLLDLMDPQVTWTTPGPADMPTAGKRVGPAAVAEFFAALDSIMQITRFEAKEFLAHGDKVVVLGEDTGVIKGTETSIEFRWAHVFTLRDGKIVSFEEFGDTSAHVDAHRALQARV